MNKKGLTMITTFFYTIVILLLWFFFIGDQLTYWGNAVVVNNNLTGLEAFLWSYLNLWLVFIPLLIFILIGVNGGGEE